MSEPTYRVELTHHPEASFAEWSATVVRISDGETVDEEYGATRERALGNAQAWVRRVAAGAHSPSTEYLTEDGDALPPREERKLRGLPADPHEVQR